MLYSKLFGKAKKSSKAYDSVNAALLQKAGFIDQVMAGVYTYLPLGLRVLNKIENIIREEMNKIGEEIFMPSLTPKLAWEQTERLNTVDILMKTAPANKFALAKNATEYILNPTHEEVVVPLGQKFVLSYRDFPFALYQIQSKFRNEPRVKSGLLRGREFRMKDLYSFHTSVEDFKSYYEKTKESYLNIFKRLGLGKDTVTVLASGGSFTEDFSHEFQTFCEAGEDTLFFVKSKKIYYNKEVTPSRAPKVKYKEKKMLKRQNVFGKGIIGVGELAKFLNIPIEKTTKTLIFETDDGRVIAAAVRGGYDINEDKLRKAAKCKALKLASEKNVKKITGAEVGYAGIINLAKNLEVYIDESVGERINFETGANLTNYHSINVNFGRDLPLPKKFYDIKIAKDGDLNPDTGEIYLTMKASEVGNIFPLYTKFTDSFNYKFIDRDGREKPIYMGCYGIGSSRIMGVIVEKFHDSHGIIWPENVAPYRFHLIGLDLKDKSVSEKVHKVYKVLKEQNQEVLFDDRVDVSAGEKFADTDLIGIPYRLVVSKKTGDKIEVKKRNEKTFQLVSLNKLV
ncbi:proline--tRNA ligase [Candidatus Roizmanbacteria bacterium RIFCSPHIGHO2_02_FULL_37_15]|uniref:Proline--tRNA ligase n=1 Tax=Candidatus Roizmanbacteria bacterium RIFCSPLOWO2_01_FULL_37_16 TaxID=1802058 RepID=A0A1F7IQI7_9BACT|nr:MAG: proline--tRNA ligase [Candidatus Roizmanbacteria bacterium RIFCSPHIGHO2_01_FULL_37_16b]OGK21147.1 MAG: proline--tRNA ligase [Candidatus Roizmanbacteria bacterium RIFCSPHIGHO2_02_FULL_37_15]OGK32744.1 MAG: proline--tRNA ligase [Candidatus Roizmanbacteria bacterium RIFCSPHIGHO2_12_FULL_36_11]OGK45625.1 MAG: proline--tRNA ligase [Candidatus Roizmanbacteria bacterium RIFCSPLOWO2_01_FULL_37_16]OGK56641.1 MAG: proline--tRNA ligase [Candidatus Roizmanbacteria bacterium RIFCSPLOWO2_02_FULL_37_9